MDKIKSFFTWPLRQAKLIRLEHRYGYNALIGFSLGDYVARCYRSFSPEDELTLIRCDLKGDFITRYITTGPIKKQFSEEAQLELFNHPKAEELLITLAGHQYLYPSVQAKVFELGKWPADDVMRHYAAAGFDMTEETQVKVLDLPHAWVIFETYIAYTMKSWSCAAQIKLLDKPNALEWGELLIKQKKGFYPAAMVELLKRRDLDELLMVALKSYSVENEEVWKAILERDDAEDLVWYLAKNLDYYNFIDYNCQIDIVKLKNRKKIFLQMMKKHTMLSDEVQIWLFKNMQREFLRYYLNAQFNLADEVIEGIFELPDAEKLILHYIGCRGSFSDKMERKLWDRFDPDVAEHMILCYVGKGASLSGEMQVFFIEHFKNQRAFVQRYARKSFLCKEAQELAQSKGLL